MIELRTIIQSMGLGVGLAMDAFSVSIADGLADPQMKSGRKTLIAGTFAAFQFLMPVVGWVCVHTISRQFESFEKAIPWIALILLTYIGGKMLIDGIRSMGGRQAGSSSDRSDGAEAADGAEDADGAGTMKRLSPGTLIAQGIATSIDALSVGFAFASFNLITAIVCSVIIGVVTFIICMFGLALGNRIGNRFTGRAEIVGGIILILIGAEIFFKGVFL